MTTGSSSFAFLAVLTACGLLAASCANVGAPVDRVRRYKVVLDERTTRSGFGATAVRTVHIDADLSERPEPDGRVAVTVDAVIATGDGLSVAAARALVGEMVAVGPRAGEVGFGIRRMSTPLSAADATLLSQVLVSFPSDVKATGNASALRLPHDAGTVLTVDQQLGPILTTDQVQRRSFDLKAAGRFASSVAGYRASSDTSNVYVPEPALVDLVGPAPDQPFVRVGSGPVRVKPGQGPLPGPLESFFNGFICFITLGLACDRIETEQDTVAVKGPPTLDIRLSGDMKITSSGQIDPARRKVLSSSTSGQSTLTGIAPSGTTVPSSIRGQELEAVSSWSMTKTLVSPRRG